ncbi:MAG: hypothetical protein GY714_20285 [Desulfobacterales bacterium]|nr:hypothetical protein [Desulfobacterales bacterium]
MAKMSNNKLLGSEAVKEEEVKAVGERGPLKLYREDYPQGRTYEGVESIKMMKKKGWTEKPAEELLKEKEEQEKLEKEEQERKEKEAEELEKKLENLDKLEKEIKDLKLTVEEKDKKIEELEKEKEKEKADKPEETDKSEKKTVKGMTVSKTKGK